MAQFILVFLLLAQTFLVLATSQSVIEPMMIQPPALSPLYHRYVQRAEAPKIRKLGKHHVSKSKPPTIGPSSDDHKENGANVSEESGMYLEKHQHDHHHESSSVNKSMTGGGVILGGLVMAFVVSIVCYLRATRRRSLVEPPTPTTVRSSPS